jgi:hypothetical protein
MPTLDWLTRGQELQRADTVAYRLLTRDGELSMGARASPKMLI